MSLTVDTVAGEPLVLETMQVRFSSEQLKSCSAGESGSVSFLCKRWSVGHTSLSGGCGNFSHTVAMIK